MDDLVSNLEKNEPSSYRNLTTLRLYVQLCLFLWLVSTIVVFLNHQTLISAILQLFSQSFQSWQVVSLDVTKPFSLLLSFSCFLGLLVISPVILVLTWKFITPGLYEHERRQLWLHLCVTLLSIIVLQAFSLLFVVPKALKFFLEFNQVYVGPIVDVFSLIDFITTIQKGFFICSLLPPALSLLLRFKVLSLYTVEKGRKWFYVGSFIVAMLLTPPDVISQCLMALPLIALFELTLVFLKLDI